MEEDSAHEYLLCSGPVAFHRYSSDPKRGGDSLTWLTLDNWWVSHERNMLVWFINDDTLAAYPGGGGSGVDDALTHWFVRAVDGRKDNARNTLKPRLPLSARPPRPPMEPPLEEGQFVYYEEAPRLVSEVKPTYPIFAREARIEGTVVLHVLVGKDGRVRNVRVARGVAGLNEAALAAAKQWVFKPALSNNKPVAVWTEVPVQFPPKP